MVENWGRRRPDDYGDPGNQGGPGDYGDPDQANVEKGKVENIQEFKTISEYNYNRYETKRNRIKKKKDSCKTPKLTTVYDLMMTDSWLTKNAEKTFKNLHIRDEINRVLDKIERGNTSPGEEIKPIKGLKNISQINAGISGGRAYILKYKGESYLVGIANKANQQKVIESLKTKQHEMIKLLRQIENNKN